MAWAMSPQNPLQGTVFDCPPALILHILHAVHRVLWVLTVHQHAECVSCALCIQCNRVLTIGGQLHWRKPIQCDWMLCAVRSITAQPKLHKVHVRCCEDSLDYAKLAIKTGHIGTLQSLANCITCFGGLQAAEHDSGGRGCCGLAPQFRWTPGR